MSNDNDDYEVDAKPNVDADVEQVVVADTSDIPVLEIIPNFYSNSVLRFQFQF